MFKKLALFSLLTIFSSCTSADLQNTLGTLLGSENLTEGEIGSGLKEALTLGIGKGSDRLSKVDGYYKSVYKILLPEEARKVTEKLKIIPGFSNVEEVILEKINRGAEDAAKKAKPIFVSAIKQITFQDALNILMGTDNAATTYLEDATVKQLYEEFNPIIIESLDKFQARKYWSDAIKSYNSLPLVDKVNPDLDDYVTNEALKGLFGMVEKEEKNIRENISARTSDLLRKVFAKQDGR